MAQGRGQWRYLVNNDTNVRVPQKTGSFLARAEGTISFSRALLREVSYVVGCLMSAISPLKATWS
jgi:hypothetical protein